LLYERTTKVIFCLFTLFFYPNELSTSSTTSEKDNMNTLHFAKNFKFNLRETHLILEDGEILSASSCLTGTQSRLK
jgi:hypothetical protein